jgi:hypothetical protein
MSPKFRVEQITAVTHRMGAPLMVAPRPSILLQAVSGISEQCTQLRVPLFLT